MMIDLSFLVRNANFFVYVRRKSTFLIITLVNEPLKLRSIPAAAPLAVSRPACFHRPPSQLIVAEIVSGIRAGIGLRLITTSGSCPFS